MAKSIRILESFFVAYVRFLPLWVLVLGFYRQSTDALGFAETAGIGACFFMGIGLAQFYHRFTSTGTVLTLQDRIGLGMAFAIGGVLMSWEGYLESALAGAFLLGLTLGWMRKLQFQQESALRSAISFHFAMGILPIIFLILPADINLVFWGGIVLLGLGISILRESSWEVENKLPAHHWRETLLLFFVLMAWFALPLYALSGPILALCLIAFLLLRFVPMNKIPKAYQYFLIALGLCIGVLISGSGGIVGVAVAFILIGYLWTDATPQAYIAAAFGLFMLAYASDALVVRTLPEMDSVEVLNNVMPELHKQRSQSEARIALYSIVDALKPYAVQQDFAAGLHITAHRRLTNVQATSPNAAIQFAHQFFSKLLSPVLKSHFLFFAIAFLGFGVLEMFIPSNKKIYHESKK